jgi:uncharacterized protein YbcI
MSKSETVRSTVLQDVANAMVQLHKDQFGRGPTKARANFANEDTLICVLEDVLLPAERKLVGMGQQDRVRESRTSFQVATEPEFVTAVEQIVARKVYAFASAVDPDHDVVFENFYFKPAEPKRDGNGALPASARTWSTT